MPRILKYQDRYDELGIDTSKIYEYCTERTEDAFRWCNMPLEEAENFIPRAILNERRGIISRINHENSFKACGEFALSFFKSKEHAIGTYKFISHKIKTRTYPYSHICSGRIVDEHGLLSEIDTNYHFELFEYSTTNLIGAFQIVEEI